MNTTTFVPASEKQIAFLESLRASRTPDVSADAVKEWARQAGRKAVSQKIDWLKAQPVVAGPISSKAQWQQQQEPEDGIYVDKDEDGNDHIFKVYKMVHGSGKQGVKVLRHTIHQSGPLAGNPKGQFSYLGLAAKHLPTSARKLSLEEAKKFGAIYGFCVRCGATLTDDDSIAAGIGPVCAGKWL